MITLNGVCLVSLKQWSLLSIFAPIDAAYLWLNEEPKEYGHSRLVLATRNRLQKNIDITVSTKEAYITDTGHRDLTDFTEDDLDTGFLKSNLILYAKETGESPTFLFSNELKEKTENSTSTFCLPASSSDSVDEMNIQKALAAMTYLLAKDKAIYSKGEHKNPNATAIRDAIIPIIEKNFPDDSNTFKSFDRKITKAISLYSKEQIFK